VRCQESRPSVQCPGVGLGEVGGAGEGARSAAAVQWQRARSGHRYGCIERMEQELWPGRKGVASGGGKQECSLCRSTAHGYGEKHVGQKHLASDCIPKRRLPCHADGQQGL
jgi:hypothetical protein